MEIKLNSSEINDSLPNPEETKGIVENLMIEHEQARNCDLFLLFVLWQDVFHLKEETMKELWARYYELTRILPSSLDRARRYIQNDEFKLIPTRVAVLRRRGFTEEGIKKFYGENSEILRVWREDTFLPK